MGGEGNRTLIQLYKRLGGSGGVRLGLGVYWIPAQPTTKFEQNHIPSPPGWRSMAAPPPCDGAACTVSWTDARNLASDFLRELRRGGRDREGGGVRGGKVCVVVVQRT